SKKHFTAKTPRAQRERPAACGGFGVCGIPEVQVEGEYLGDPRDKDIRNCVPCDVNQIKKALKEAQ
ncbi:MAG: hypothetical protein MUF69_05745, partial [Desulfobacterota bacterium]|nr:hypothetical protein [Thermodesulfobacteriota bacterium]